jgi:hypothetical protein
MSQITEYMTLGDREYWVGCIVRKDTFAELEEKRYKFAWDHIPDPFKEQYLEVLGERSSVGNLKKRIVVDYLANICDRIDESEGEDHELYKAARDFVFSPDAIERPVVDILKSYADATLELEVEDSNTIEIVHKEGRICPCCKAEEASIKTTEVCVIEVDQSAKEEVILSFARNVAEMGDVEEVDVTSISICGVFNAVEGAARSDAVPIDSDQVAIYIQKNVDKIVDDAFGICKERCREIEDVRCDRELFELRSSLPAYEIIGLFRRSDSDVPVVYGACGDDKSFYKSRYKNNRTNSIITKRQYVLGEIFGGAVQEFYLRGGSGKDIRDKKRKKRKKNRKEKEKSYFNSNIDHDRDRYGMPVDFEELSKKINFDHLYWDSDFDIEGGTDWSGEVLNWSYSDNPYMVTNVFRDDRNVIREFDSTFQKYEKCLFTSIELNLDFMSHIDAPLFMCVWKSTLSYDVDSMTLQELESVFKDKNTSCYDIQPLGNTKVEFRVDSDDLFVNSNDLSFYWQKDGGTPTLFYINVAIYGLKEWPEEVGNVVSSVAYNVQWT